MNEVISKIDIAIEYLQLAKESCKEGKAEQEDVLSMLSLVSMRLESIYNNVNKLISRKYGN